VFFAVAILTLGIGLGTTSLMFTTANAAFLQPLPFPSDGLVRVWQVSQRSNSVNVPPQVWRDWRDGLNSVTSLAASGRGNREREQRRRCRACDCTLCAALMI
jgi:hypothetical protein